MEALARVAQDEPLETRARLELLRREVTERVHDDPVAVANFGLVVEHGRSMLERQVRHALLLLAQRQDEIEQLHARVKFLEGRLAQVERRCQPRSWWMWWG